MNKLEDYKKYIGKYIRNQYGIAKILDVTEQSNNIYIRLDNRIVFSVDTRDGSIRSGNLSDIYPITEQTQNLDERIKPLIELIEPGDYVNGLYVHGIYDSGLEVYMFGDAHEILYPDEIKDVVTREQFEKIKYRA